MSSLTSKSPTGGAGPPRGIEVEHILGATLGVWYPNRKRPDLYVSLKDRPMFCARCNTEFPEEELPAHVRSHDPRRKRKRKLDL